MSKCFWFVILINLVVVNYSFADNIFNGKSDQELFNDFQKNPTMGHNPINVKYIYMPLYVGMPEQKFLELYKRNENFKEITLRPIIKKQVKNRYYLETVGEGRYRVTFSNGQLKQLEVLIREKPPFAFLTYSDYTYMLNGYEIIEGLYRWMPESEFLSKFERKIIVKHEDGYYSVENSDGIQFGVTFLNGFLDDAWRH